MVERKRERERERERERRNKFEKVGGRGSEIYTDRSAGKRKDREGERGKERVEEMN